MNNSAPTRVLVADPPWRFGDNLPGPTRGAARQYKTMSVPEIMTFQLPTLAPDALLMLWRVSSMQREALDVVRAWGFTLKSEIVWEKLTRTGKPWFGMGRYVRAAHETCLVCTKGRFKVRDRSVRSRFSAPVPTGPDGRYIHSAKPEKFFDLVERLADGPYVELFARRHRPGWLCLGDEVAREDPASLETAATESA